MVPRAQEPPLFSVQMVLLIGHHLSVITLSIDYHRWNVICSWWVPNRLWNSESNTLLSSDKAPGSDAIPAEIYSCKEDELFHIMWGKEAIPKEFKDASIIHLFKRNENPQLCDNHRGISLLSIAGKVLARVLLHRLIEHLEQTRLLPESQCGFRKDRGTIDIIFTARQLQKKCQKKNMDL